MRCFILGNGPSLNDVDLTLLKDEATFGCNRIYLKWSDMGYPVTNYFLIDTYFCSSLRLEVQPYLDRGVKKFFVKHHSDRYMHSDKVHVGEGFISVGEGMLTYAAEMGYDQIYLLGIDMDYSGLKQRLGAERGVTKLNGDDQWHFDRSYCDNGFYYEKKQGVVAHAMFKDAFNRLSGRGIKIYNASGNGKLEYIPIVDYYSLFE